MAETKVMLGQVIATRTYGLQDGEVTRAVVVKMGLPMPFDPGQPDGDFYCPYEIEGLGDGQVRCAGGIDALQALQLAQAAVGLHLANSAAYREGRLYWFEPGDPTLGLPKPGGTAPLAAKEPGV